MKANRNHVLTICDMNVNECEMSNAETIGSRQKVNVSEDRVAFRTGAGAIVSAHVTAFKTKTEPFPSRKNRNI